MLKRNKSRFFVEVFVSQCKKTLQGNRSVLCFGKFPVANMFVDEKDAGVYRSFLSIRFCLRVPKKFVGEPSMVSLISGIEKIYA